ncbi:hypothetical protein OIU77_019544 [Salix suchowensis]|uniref:Uncharacterized protein n=1 Tax=Salix suchowensis TaxID=1278906 RepID=A0ABQ9CGJ7_9ROSI|nr:hypothetical protein OIU77_019544 [Salix suchowensis]
MMNITRSPRIFFLFNKNRWRRKTKGSSMIGESNAELFSTRTSLSTLQGLEVRSASEMLGAIENGSLSRKGHEPINIFSLGIEMWNTMFFQGMTRRTYRPLMSDQSKNRAPTTSGQEEVNLKMFFSFKQLGVEKRIEELMLNGRIRC